MTAADDISWSTADAKFDLRVAAVITRAGSVLLCTVPTAGCWFLPGGRVRFGEPSEAALERELEEELGHSLPAGTLAMVMENIYVKEGELRHEVGLYYRQEWPPGLAPGDIHGGSEPDDEFRWAPVSGLAAEGFQPAALISLIAAEPGPLRHVVSDRRTGEVTVDGQRAAGLAPSALPQAGPDP